MDAETDSVRRGAFGGPGALEGSIRSAALAVPSQ